MIRSMDVESLQLLLASTDADFAVRVFRSPFAWIAQLALGVSARFLHLPFAGAVHWQLTYMSEESLSALEMCMNKLPDLAALGMAEEDKEPPSGLWYFLSVF